MIKGIKYWNNSSIRYEQTQNATEAIIRKVKIEINKELKKNYKEEDIDINLGYLESCGASAFCTIMEGMGILKPADYPQINGQRIQFDDFVMMYLNDPHKDILFYPGNSMDNRWIYSYPTLAKELFNVSSKMHWGASALSFDQAAKELTKGNGIQICLKRPGHYLACIAYDDDKDAILFSDSWGSRPGNKNGGWQEVLTRDEYNNNTVNHKLVYLSKW